MVACTCSLNIQHPPSRYLLIQKSLLAPIAPPPKNSGPQHKSPSCWEIFITEGWDNGLKLDIYCQKGKKLTAVHHICSNQAIELRVHLKHTGQNKLQQNPPSSSTACVVEQAEELLLLDHLRLLLHQLQSHIIGWHLGATAWVSPNLIAKELFPCLKDKHLSYFFSNLSCLKACPCSAPSDSQNSCGDRKRGGTFGSRQGSQRTASSVLNNITNT